jgi:hypothetical protein
MHRDLKEHQWQKHSTRPNKSCKIIGFHIKLQIYAIGIGWLLVARPPKNRTSLRCSHMSKCI